MHGDADRIVPAVERIHPLTRLPRTGPQDVAGLAAVERLVAVAGDGHEGAVRSAVVPPVSDAVIAFGDVAAVIPGLSCTSAKLNLSAIMSTFFLSDLWQVVLLMIARN